MKKVSLFVLGVFIFIWTFLHFTQVPSMNDLEKRHPDMVISKGDKNNKSIAITFDDGPDNLITPKVLDILSKENVKATFFVVGELSQANPNVLKRIVEEKHAIGNHSWTHPNFEKLNDEDSNKEIELTEQKVFEITGKKMALFRPPYGLVTEKQVQILSQQGYKVIGWNVDPSDYKDLVKEDIIKAIEDKTHNGSIILEHSAGGDWTKMQGIIEALPIVIEDLKRKGYTFKTIPELLNIPEIK